MSVVKEFALPDLGEGLTESEIVSWRVGVGDTVELNQVIAEVETAKALVELPSPFAGVVNRLYAEPGTTVEVGAPIMAFEIDDGPGTQPAETAGPAAVAGPAENANPAEHAGSSHEGAAAGRQPVLVGYGPEVESGERPKRRPRTGDVARDARPAPRDERDERHAAAERARSTPPVRKLARDLGVDLTQVAGTGEHGLVTRDDVEALAGGVSSAPSNAPRDAPRRQRRIPITGVRKRTAQAMVASAFSAPHVTEFLTVDVTATMELLASLRSKPAFHEHRLTVLTVVAKALCMAVRRTPDVNARWDDAAGEIVQFGYVNLGIAVATPRGLVVPSIPSAETLSLVELADSLAEATAQARAGRTSPARLTGGTITITNVGVFGVDAGTPILNPGEAAILAIGAVRSRPWEYHGEVALRQVMSLSLSFDHRMVDGEQGSRFLADIGSILAEPGLALTMV